MATNRSPLVQTLWENWLHHNDQTAANGLIEQYMYLVSYHVERISGNLPNYVSNDDLKSFGMIGLYDALNKFQHNRNLKFDTYASFRIRGAIMDGLRNEDWLPRSIREKTKKIERAAQELEQYYQREPTAEEIAAKLQMSTEEVEERTRDQLIANVLSIEEKTKQQEHEYKEGIGYTIPDDSSGSPDERMLQAERNAELADSIRYLTEKEQLVVSLFYHQELTFTEIGHVLELTTSRISQIHRKAIFKLRKTLLKIQDNPGID
ncbi:FliA/WhiG family RNA polymerase sigma factor [Lentibacillus cibarius]|uniref:FliA/WhiG family RNA polymerase sigma factor n=1 Tax=Lentibacillus cibarius TaxID=2583219 RepID=A0A5S3QP69_9BACI|nr:FliA/WhiG family RNA polymerase sigma factor [Lentibacillus cibarius]TMN23599.1 FliA/WhiG family RNA polymerase sigma factor [Lentibacillus cibarius]